MIPGIDPKVDIAFKKIFGSEESRHLPHGDGYHQLSPTISICFVNGRRFPEGDAYHQRFFSGPQHGD